MKTSYEVIKNQSKGYTVIVRRENGETNDYRFNTKKEVNEWMKWVRRIGLM